VIGLIRIARRAGIAHATSATAVSRAIVPVKVGKSVAETPCSELASARAPARPPARPIRIPTPTIVTRLRDEDQVEGVVLGGTELPLFATTPTIAGLPALDTTALHVAAIVDKLREG
jgi:hypothetical protein